jgi:hypothetical protein
MLVLILAISGRTIPDLFTAATSLLAGFTTATMREDTISMDEALPPRILAMLTSRMDLEVAITVVEVIGKGREIADCGGLHLKYFEVEELYATTPADITTAVRCATRDCAATHSLPAWRGVLAPPSIFKMISVSAWDEPLGPWCVVRDNMLSVCDQATRARSWRVRCISRWRFWS